MTTQTTKTDFQAFGASMAVWIARRTRDPVPVGACAETIATAESIVTACRVPVLVPDLWPNSRLEMLYVPPEDTPPGPAIAANFSGEISRAVLRAIGQYRHRHAAA